MNISVLAQYAQAAYADLSNGMSGLGLRDALQAPQGDFALTQAINFAAEQTVLLQYNDDAAGAGGNDTSLSLTVFKDLRSRKRLASYCTVEGINAAWGGVAWLV